MSVTLGEYLHDLRHEAGETLRETAGWVGLSASYLCDIENGKRTPSYEVVQRLAEHFEAGEEEMGAMAFKFGGDVETYVRETPAVGRLLGVLAFKQLDDDGIRELIKAATDL